MKKASIVRTAYRIVSIPKKYIGGLIYQRIRDHGGILYFGLPHTPENKKIHDTIANIKAAQRQGLGDMEFQNLYSLVKKAEKIDGDIAEVGVWKGGSAKLILEATKKQVHLFDTFEGMPNIVSGADSGLIKKGDYRSSYNDVRDYLKEYPNVHLYRGLFPSTSWPVKEKKFSLVNFDVDIYESTKSCLDFFYPRMSPGGIMISHDYGHSGNKATPGVKKAFDEFFANKPEIVFEPAHPGLSQCFVVKI